MKKIFSISIPIWIGLFACYDKPKTNVKPIYTDNLDEIGKLSNFNTIICGGINEKFVKKVAFRKKAYRKLNQDEKFKLEECITFGGAIIDTSEQPGQAYLFDSTIYVDFGIISDANRKYLSLSYPFGWDNWCGTGVENRKFNIKINDSIYSITNEIKN